jgi:hypothetical protein
MGIIDRILSGEFDEEKDSVKAKNGGQLQSGKAKITDPEEDEDELDDDETPRDDFENLPTEEVDDSAGNYTISDIPDDNFMREYTLENNIEVFDGRELVGAAPTQYVEKPKQSKVRETGKKKTMTTNDTETTPKQSTTKTDTAETKKRGAPHKLGDNTAEVCRLYTEGVGAKLIAEKFGVSVSCVINTLKRNNITIRPKGRRKTAE